MKHIKKYICLSREALLFDSPIYILKSFMGIITAYILFKNHNIIGKDMISVLFAMMLTLEPNNIAGIKSGISQVKASWVGGIVTAIIISLFGINVVTIPLAIAITLYVMLLGNWKEISPVAIFTAIYMTQYVQYNQLGEASVFLTLRLRLMALMAGILVAIFYNYIFSKFFYRKMTYKRHLYLIERTIFLLRDYENSKTIEELGRIKKDAMSFLQEIDYVISRSSAKEKRTEFLEEMKTFNFYFIELILYSKNIEGKKIDISEVIKILEKLPEFCKNTKGCNSGDMKYSNVTFDDETNKGLSFENPRIYYTYLLKDSLFNIEASLK